LVWSAQCQEPEIVSNHRVSMNLEAELVAIKLERFGLVVNENRCVRHFLDHHSSPNLLVQDT
jgi:hypothetical protein